MQIVTITSKRGAFGRRVAQAAAQRLGYRLLDREEMEAQAALMGVAESVHELGDHAPSRFERIFSHRPAIELERLHSVLFELAAQGSCVFLDRGAQVLLRAFDCALHVFVTASVPTRIANLVDEGYSAEGAAKAVHRSDRERGAYVRFATGADWEDVTLYDLVFNTDKIPPDLAAETVARVARSPHLRPCAADAARSLANLALASRAEGALGEAGLSYGPDTDVHVASVDGGCVQLTGRVGDEASRRRAEDVVRAVSGVGQVDNRIRVGPADRHA